MTTRDEHQQRQMSAMHTALRDIHTCAAEALVNRSAETVEALESLCESFMERFAGRVPNEDKVRRIMDALSVTEDDAIKAIVSIKTGRAVR